MKAILLFALSAIILSQSYGFAHAVHVSAHLGQDLEIEPPITVATDSSSYEEGEMINVSGSVSDYIESDPFKNFDVALRLIAPQIIISSPFLKFPLTVMVLILHSFLPKALYGNLMVIIPYL